MNSTQCKEHAAECKRMAAREPNSRVQAILTDMARTWDRLAIEAEIASEGRAGIAAVSDLKSTIFPAS